MRRALSLDSNFSASFPSSVAAPPVNPNSAIRIPHSEMDYTTAKGDTTTLTMTMRFASRAERDAALETGMADGVAIGYDRLDEILASSASRK